MSYVQAYYLVVDGDHHENNCDCYAVNLWNLEDKYARPKLLHVKSDSELVTGQEESYIKRMSLNLRFT